MSCDLRLAERFDLLLCPGVDSTAGGKDMICRLCIRLSSRWTPQQQQWSAVAKMHLYEPSELIDGHCHALLLGHPEETT